MGAMGAMDQSPTLTSLTLTKWQNLSPLALLYFDSGTFCVDDRNFGVPWIQFCAPPLVVCKSTTPAECEDEYCYCWHGPEPQVGAERHNCVWNVPRPGARSQSAVSRPQHLFSSKLKKKWKQSGGFQLPFQLYANQSVVMNVISSLAFCILSWNEVNLTNCGG